MRFARGSAVCRVTFQERGQGCNHSCLVCRPRRPRALRRVFWAVAQRFHGRRPECLDSAGLSAAAVACWLRELRGTTPISSLAEMTGASRFRISRWLRGRAEPRLPELLMLVDARTRRLFDFIATITDPARMPSRADRYHELERAREVDVHFR